MNMFPLWQRPQSRLLVAVMGGCKADIFEPLLPYLLSDE